MTVDDTGSGTGADGRVDPLAAEPGEDPLALRLEHLILGAERRYTPFQAARSAGVSVELATRFWRAMGFADIGQAKALTEADVLALRRLSGLVEAGRLRVGRGVAVARGHRGAPSGAARWREQAGTENTAHGPLHGHPVRGERQVPPFHRESVLPPGGPGGEAPKPPDLPRRPA